MPAFIACLLLPVPVFNLDVGQLKLVYEALQERRSLLDNAPHLTSTLPILMPCYKWWEVPFYWAGLKTYDLIAGELTNCETYAYLGSVSAAGLIQPLLGLPRR